MISGPPQAPAGRSSRPNYPGRRPCLQSAATGCRTGQRRGAAAGRALQGATTAGVAYCCFGYARTSVGGKRLDGAVGVRARLAGQRVLLTGVTGFVGEALLERLLSDVPEAKLVVLVRARGGLSAHDRVDAAARQARVRRAARAARSGSATASSTSASTVIEGDLAGMPDLPPDLDTVVHCAGEVSFDPPIDDGFATNLGGVRSCCGPSGRGAQPAAAPLRARLHRLRRGPALRARSRRAAVDALRRLADRAGRRLSAPASRPRTPRARRTSLREVQRRGRRRARAAPGPRPSPATPSDAAASGWMRELSTPAGSGRAASAGPTATPSPRPSASATSRRRPAGAARASIVRPSIIESALARPHPGLDRGLQDGRADHPGVRPRRAARLPRRTGRDRSTSSRSTSSSTRSSPPPRTRRRRGEPVYYHVCSGSRNPLLFRELYEHRPRLLRAPPADQARPRARSRLPKWRFAGRPRIERPAASAASGPSPLAERARRHCRTASRVARARDARPADRRSWSSCAATTISTAPTRRPSWSTPTTATPQRCTTRSTREDQPEFGFDPTCFDWDGLPAGRALPDASPAGLRAMSALAGRRPPRHAARDAVRRPTACSRSSTWTARWCRSTVVESYLWLRLAGAARAGRGCASSPRLARPLPGWLRAERRDRGRLIRAVYTRYAGPIRRSSTGSSTRTSATHVLPRVSAAGAAPGPRTPGRRATAPCCSPARSSR